tara:strand:- start:961 stop:1206 length:246 start_codon:yes stop_codon:yes gene_type:complete
MTSIGDLDSNESINLNDLIYLQAYVDNIYDSSYLNTDKIIYIAQLHENYVEGSSNINELALGVLKNHVSTEKNYALDTKYE